MKIHVQGGQKICMSLIISSNCITTLSFYQPELHQLSFTIYHCTKAHRSNQGALLRIKIGIFLHKNDATYLYVFEIFAIEEQNLVIKQRKLWSRRENCVIEKRRRWENCKCHLGLRRQYQRNCLSFARFLRKHKRLRKWQHLDVAPLMQTIDRYII